MTGSQGTTGVEAGFPNRSSSSRFRTDRLCDLAVFGFASFTLLCHLVVAVGGGFAALRVAALVLAAVLVGLALLRVSRMQGPTAWTRADFALWGMVVAGFAIPLFFHQVSHDDAWYLNVGVRSVMDPVRPLLRYDSLHGIDGLAVVMPVWRVEAFPLLAACIASTTPWSVIEASHWVVAALSGAFLPIALARVFGWLTPRHRVASVAVSLAILALLASAPRGYGAYALGLQHQGKGVFLSAGVPLLIFYAARFASGGGLRRGIALAAAQLACVGLTSTAVWAAPLVSLLGAAVGAGNARSGSVVVRRLVGVVATSLYPLGIGLGLRDAMTANIAAISERATATELLDQALEIALASPSLGIFALMVCATGWSVAPAGPARRLCVIFPGVFVAVLYNPLVARTVATQLTGDPTYFRVFWVLPLPLILTLVATAPLRLGLLPRFVRGLAVVGIVASLALMTSPRSGSHRDSVRRFEALGLDVDPEAYAAAGDLIHHAAAGRFVLAPNEVSLWVGTQRDAPFAVIPRLHYFRLIRPKLHAAEAAWREALAAPYVRSLGALPEDTGTAWDDGLDAHRIDAVCLVKARQNTRFLRERLGRLGFESVAESLHYEIWARTSPIRRPGPRG